MLWTQISFSLIQSKLYLMQCLFMSADLSVSWHYFVTLRRVCTRPRERLLQNYRVQRHAVFLQDILSIKDEKLFKAYSHYK